MTPADRPTRLVRALRDVVDELGPGGAGHPADRPGPSRVEARRETAVTTRATDGGLLVVATPPGTAAVDLSADLDREVGVLTLGVDGEVVDRVPLEDAGWTIEDVSFDAGVLEVSLGAARRLPGDG